MMSYELKPKKGSVRDKKRLGCGRGSGLGKTSGKGHKGQRARSGQKRPYMGFEGGQMPLYRRIPKRGFNHQPNVEYEILNIRDLFLVNKNEISIQDLFDAGLVNNLYSKVKLLGDGEINKAITITVNKASKSAIEKIEAAGGKVNIIE
ncbi:MAG TPA: 50S ribosomal protein L15 [Spirochaetota bacterium]|nr:50S ribosomal protein L15 [Spirochaetota bacterium]HOM37933.1 50S ribosomal protein L15 [Spirochaetota bacterium]HPQ48737.1 50S ribosomal protein L15 [Spirochaetota bacterium]